MDCEMNTNDLDSNSFSGEFQGIAVYCRKKPNNYVQKGVESLYFVCKYTSQESGRSQNPIFNHNFLDQCVQIEGFGDI